MSKKSKNSKKGDILEGGFDFDGWVDRGKFRKIIKVFFKELGRGKDYEKVESGIFRDAKEKFSESEFKNECNFRGLYISVFTMAMVGVSMKFHRFYGRYLINEIVDNEDFARRLERSMYTGVIDKAVKNNIDQEWESSEFVKLYRNKILAFVANLDGNSYIGNKEFLKRIQYGDYDIKTLGTISEKDWFPERHPNVINDSIRSIDLSAACSHFKCGKCKQSKTVYYELQTRSGDEAMCVFITCVATVNGVMCGNRWKMG